MMAWVLFIAVIFFVLLFYRKHDLRESFIFGSLVFSAVLLVLTEVLSSVEAITFPALFAAWVLIDLSLFIYLLKKIGFSNLFDKLKKSLSSIDHNCFLWMIAVALLVTFVVALVAAPNNYDSMTYHMTRVAYWMQNHTVAHFPTHNTRQIFMSPWVEYVILHLQVLSFGSDRLVNLVQWGTYAGTLTISSLIAAHFSASRAAQWLAAFLVATTPMAILQASSTQTDMACSYWVLVFAWATLKLVDSNTHKISAFWWVSALALALAISTKGTAYIFCAPLVLGLFLVKLIRKDFWGIVKGGLVFVILVLTLNGPHYARNFTTFADPLGDPASVQKLKNSSYSLAVLGSNLLRNLSLHLQTPVAEVNDVTERVVTKLHEWWDFDVSDPATTWGEYQLSTIILQEDVAGNLLFFLLILLTIGCLVFRQTSKYLYFYVICSLAGFVLFSWLLKWQPWGSRLVLPFFMMWAPVCSVVLVDSWHFPRRLILSMAGIYFFCSLPWLFYNTSRPILINQYNVEKNILRTPRIAQYFNTNRDYEVPFYYAMQKINDIGCREVGLKTHLDSYEYPLVAIQRINHPGDTVNFHHVFVENASATLSRSGPEVCAILAIDQDDNWLPPTSYGAWQNIYRRYRVQVFALNAE